MKIDVAGVYVRQLLNDLKEVYAISAEEKGLDIELHIDESVPDIILSDEVRLRQILFNLVNNAVKFTRQGKVVISAVYEPEVPEDLFPVLKYRWKIQALELLKKIRKIYLKYLYSRTIRVHENLVARVWAWQLVYAWLKC